MTSPRIVVMGYSDIGHACLKFLLDRRENVVALYTHADNPNDELWFPSIAKLADQNNIPTVFDANFKDPMSVECFKRLKPDILFSFYYKNMIPLPVLSHPALGAYNMHGSYLPAYRGRAPVNWAVLNGEKETGATLHMMVEKPDAGDIIDQEKVSIGPDDTAAQVQAGVCRAAVAVLARQIENIKSGKPPRRPQDQSKSSYFGRRRPEDGRFDWSWPAGKIHNLVRAVSKPYPGAETTLNGAAVKIWKTRLTGKKVSSGAGHARSEGSRLFVSCGDGLEIEILEKENA